MRMSGSWGGKPALHLRRLPLWHTKRSVGVVVLLALRSVGRWVVVVVVQTVWVVLLVVAAATWYASVKS